MRVLTVLLDWPRKTVLIIIIHPGRWKRQSIMKMCLRMVVLVIMFLIVVKTSFLHLSLSVSCCVNLGVKPPTSMLNIIIKLDFHSLRAFAQWHLFYRGEVIVPSLALVFYLHQDFWICNGSEMSDHFHQRTTDRM